MINIRVREIFELKKILERAINKYKFIQILVI